MRTLLSFPVGQGGGTTLSVVCERLACQVPSQARGRYLPPSACVR